ncbi:hypothetical protein H310_00261 [Aphanomyces invadans]|uniref:Uncharacterized protein n=1 Tax=Aphanomyces invadans TaxID=157072 RepID=A0A024UUZ5_9STRA|nr:hypothetical protein H310_00261 [Aphanomyces invadans]ETW09780.1 hypothetical protein H310_00261 [Aphanomyces invadans]|eukprot:XP_008861191.1 hypothetical protein H310_00261 [Aphanomyces invadans]
MGSDNGAKTATLDSGLPALTEAEKKSSYGALFGGVLIPLAVGTGIAFAVYTFGPKAAYDKRIKVVLGNELHWVALAIVLLGRTVAIVNMYPATILKGQIMRRNSGNLRSNPFIYKAIGKDAKENAVVFIDDGEVGAYNRANRSLHHMIENYGSLVAGLLLAGNVFAFPVFVATALFAVGRIVHQVGYTTGYGSHGLGFVLSLIAIVTVEGMLLIVGLKGLKLI